ncbi:MAG: zinc-ribbon domain-containing protein [Clostridia bacterium]|nr:zinc-ribbon domain-containing protein [Clostridia bacterium]
MFCKKCGKEIDDKAAICPHCSSPAEEKPRKKSILKRWWFWVIIGVVIIAVIGSSSGSDNQKPSSEDPKPSQSAIGTSGQGDDGKEEEKIQYVKTDLKTMLDELEANALKAEKTYQDQYVEVVGEITNFDSDGSYISIEPINADEWNFSTALCKIKNDDQLNFLLEKKTGDKVTIKGQITSVGEVLGYTIKIAEVS